MACNSSGGKGGSAAKGGAKGGGGGSELSQYLDKIGSPPKIQEKSNAEIENDIATHPQILGFNKLISDAKQINTPAVNKAREEMESAVKEYTNSYGNNINEMFQADSDANFYRDAIRNLPLQKNVPLSDIEQKKLDMVYDKQQSADIRRYELGNKVRGTFDRVYNAKEKLEALLSRRKKKEQ